MCLLSVVGSYTMKSPARPARHSPAGPKCRLQARQVQNSSPTLPGIPFPPVTSEIRLQETNTGQVWGGDRGKKWRDQGLKHKLVVDKNRSGEHLPDIKAQANHSLGSEGDIEEELLTHDILKESTENRKKKNARKPICIHYLNFSEGQVWPMSLIHIIWKLLNQRFKYRWKAPVTGVCNGFKENRSLQITVTSQPLRG